jgi:hypothetical protein
VRLVCCNVVMIINDSFYVIITFMNSVFKRESRLFSDTSINLNSLVIARGETIYMRVLVCDSHTCFFLVYYVHEEALVYVYPLVEMPYEANEQPLEDTKVNQLRGDFSNRLSCK